MSPHADLATDLGSAPTARSRPAILTRITLAKTLLETYKIWANAIDSPAIGVQGVRITPHVFIQPAELNVLVTAISDVTRALKRRLD